MALLFVDGFADRRMLETLMESVDQMRERSKKDTDSISSHVMHLVGQVPPLAKAYAHSTNHLGTINNCVEDIVQVRENGKPGRC